MNFFCICSVDNANNKFQITLQKKTNRYTFTYDWYLLFLKRALINWFLIIVCFKLYYQILHVRLKLGNSNDCFMKIPIEMISLCSNFIYFNIGLWNNVNNNSLLIKHIFTLCFKLYTGAYFCMRKSFVISTKTSFFL